MMKQAGAYGAEDQIILPVPTCGRLTHNHRRQPVTAVPITLMAQNSLPLALAPSTAWAHQAHRLPSLGEAGGLAGTR